MKKALLLVTMALCLVHGQSFAQASKPYGDCFGEEVIFARQGLNQVNGPVDPNRSDPTLALGEPYTDINGNYSDAFDSFYSLGFGGEIIIRTAPIANETGADIYINEATFQRACDTHPETIRVYASQDNINYIYLGEGCQDSEYDLTGADGTLAWAQYFRILDVSNPDDFPVEKNIDGYDVDGLVCLSGAPDAATYAIQPIVTCVTDNGNGTFTASFGYESPNSVEVTIPAGTDNLLSPSGLIATLPEAFQPGRQDAAFTVDFVAGTSVTWTVGGRSAVASSASTACNAAQATATISGTALLCNGTADEGTITVALTGTAPWSVTVQKESNGDITTFDIDNITVSPYQFNTAEEGVYTLTAVSDANGEGTVSGYGTIAYYNQASAMLTGGQAIYCGAASDFEVVFSGTPPFSFTYTDGSSQTTINNIIQQTYSFSVNDPGTYSLVSMQDANCAGTVEGEAVVQVLDPLATISGQGTIFCDESETISISLSGVKPYTFTYTDGNTSTTINNYEEDTYTFEATEGATFNLVSFDAAGCTGLVSGSAEVMMTEPSASIASYTDICGSTTGSMTVTLAGRAPFTFTYSDGVNQTTINNINASTYDVTGLPAGTYSLVSMEDSGCPGAASGSVTIEEINPEASISAPAEVCENGPIELSATSNPGAISYIWSTTGTGVLSSTTASAVTYTPASGETGVVTFSLEVDTDCGSASTQTSVTINESASASFTASSESVLTGEEVTFTPADDSGDDYSYDYGDGTTGNTGSHVYDVAGIYEVTLTVTKNNCQTRSSINISVESAQGVLYVPNVFSPSSVNAENQVVKVYGAGISSQDFAFEIYNRWGDLLYKTSSFAEANTQGWDGMVSGNLQPNGVYTYVLRGRMDNGESFEKTGTISLVR